MLGGSSVALAFSIGPIFAVAAGALLGIGVIYSYRLKGVPVVGHSTVALLSASTVVYGAAAAGTVRSSVLIGSALVVCFIFVGEVLGAIEDREADAAVGLSTIAVRNPRAAQLLFEVSAAASILLAPAAWLVGEASDAFVVVIAVVVLPLVAGSVAALRFGSSPRGTVLAVRLMKAVWIGGLPGLLLLR